MDSHLSGIYSISFLFIRSVKGYEFVAFVDQIIKYTAHLLMNTKIKYYLEFDEAYDFFSSLGGLFFRRVWK